MAQTMHKASSGLSWMPVSADPAATNPFHRQFAAFQADALDSRDLPFARGAPGL